MKLIIVPLLLTSFSSFAVDPTFEAEKAQLIAKVDGEISSLNEQKSCFQAATDKMTLQACNEKIKAQGDKLKTELNNKKMDFKNSWSKKKN